MADIGASDVTYTPVAGGSSLFGRPPKYRNRVTIAFGNNTLNYPTGGIPLSATKLGLPQGQIESLRVIDQDANAKGYKFEWNSVNNKLLAMVEDTVSTNTPLKQHTNATFVPNPATLIVEAVGY
jgi:hypothetical protein